MRRDARLNAIWVGDVARVNCQGLYGSNVTLDNTLNVKGYFIHFKMIRSCHIVKG
jgi:hypothetical protein